MVESYSLHFGSSLLSRLHKISYIGRGKICLAAGMKNLIQEEII